VFARFLSVMILRAIDNRPYNKIPYFIKNIERGDLDTPWKSADIMF